MLDLRRDNNLEVDTFTFNNIHALNGFILAHGVDNIFWTWLEEDKECKERKNEYRKWNKIYKHSNNNNIIQLSKHTIILNINLPFPTIKPNRFIFTTKHNLYKNKLIQLNKDVVVLKMDTEYGNGHIYPRDASIKAYNDYTHKSFIKSLYKELHKLFENDMIDDILQVSNKEVSFVTIGESKHHFNLFKYTFGNDAKANMDVFIEIYDKIMEIKEK